MLFAKDGYGLIIGSFIILGIIVVLYWFFRHPVLLAMAIVVGLFSLFNLYFFRDPERLIPENERAILSPADGRIVRIDEVEEPVYFHEKVRRISIFLSVFDVHVNRVPFSGRVDFFAYQRGRFLMAFKDEASEENEQTQIGIVDEKGRRVFFKQIAGIIARRIVCHLREGFHVRAGERMGMIRYGSRVDVFFPLETQVLVRPRQHVKAGETILAVFSNDEGRESEEEHLVETPLSETF